jgi:hypothetical protein
MKVADLKNELDDIKQKFDDFKNERKPANA